MKHVATEERRLNTERGGWGTLPTGKKTKEEKTQKKLLKILLSTQITANFVSFQNRLVSSFFRHLFDFRENRKQQKR